MNTRHIITLLAGLGALAFIGCAPKTDKPTPATSTDHAVDRAADSARDTAVRAGDALASSWNHVKDATYDQRVQFRASLDDLAASVDKKINELQARSTTASDSTKQTWNKGLEQLRAARADLKREIGDLGNATAETWNQARADVASAWERVHRSYSDLEAQRTTS